MLQPIQTGIWVDKVIESLSLGEGPIRINISVDSTPIVDYDQWKQMHRVEHDLEEEKK